MQYRQNHFFSLPNCTRQDEEAYYAFKLREEYKRSFVSSETKDSDLVTPSTTTTTTTTTSASHPSTPSSTLTAIVGQKIRHHLKMTPLSSCSGGGSDGRPEDESQMPLIRETGCGSKLGSAKAQRKSQTLPANAINGGIVEEKRAVR